jgi:hypothetical protein
MGMQIKSGIIWKRVSLSIDTNRRPADAYIFERELEQLHPDNRNIKANPENNNTGQEFASSFRNFATVIYFCTSTATAGACRDFVHSVSKCSAQSFQLARLRLCGVKTP